MTKCAGLAGWLAGHKYEPRYSTIQVRISDAVWIEMARTPADFESGSDSLYECDVCVRCGSRINARTSPVGALPEEQE
jgi:hypothetical protein